MANLVLPPGIIISSRFLQSDEWLRPSDWLTLPSLFDGDEEIAGLFAVYDTATNYVAFAVAGAYTVDWGDGGAAEDVATGVTAEHAYTYADLDASTATVRGYRQALITITPQGAGHITSVNFNINHSSAGAGHVTPWLDMEIAGLNITALFVGGVTVNNSLMEQFRWVGSTNAGLTSGRDVFKDLLSLQSIVLFDMINITDMYGMFRNCPMMRNYPDMNTVACENFSYTFHTNTSMQIHPEIDYSSATNISGHYYHCPRLQTARFPNLTSSNYRINNLFNGDTLLQIVYAFENSGATYTDGAFLYCPSLISAPLAGTAISISYLDCNLDQAAIVAIFNGLASGVTAQTITITGNPGVADLTAANRLIATDKGWTIAE